MEISERQGIWFAVINGYAASKHAIHLWEQAERLMKAKGLVWHGNRTGKSGNAMEITFDACMAGYRKFIAVGGDGTVHDVLNGVAAYVEWNAGRGTDVKFSDFTLGVIPVGSGNDWIKSVGLSKDIDTAVEALVTGSLRPQDVVKVTMLDCADRELSVSYMANIGGVGIDARVCEYVNRKKIQGKRGKILYVTSLIQALRHRRPAFAKVLCDGEVIFDGAYFSMAFGIGKYSGGGMRQTPDAVIDDRLLDITIIPDIPLRRIVREAPRLFTGTFLKVPELTAAKGRVFTVMPRSMECAEPVEVDGEVTGKAPVRMEVIDSQINVVTGK